MEVQQAHLDINTDTQLPLIPQINILANNMSAKSLGKHF